MRVQKNTGRTEEFDRDKIFNSIVGATATPAEAEVVTKHIEEWLESLSDRDTVTTVEIKAKVAEMLKNLDPAAAKLYIEFDREK